MKDFLQYTLITIGQTTIKVESILTLFIFILSIYLFSRFVKKIIYRFPGMDDAKKYSIFSLFRYFIYTLSAVVGMQILGFDITILLAGSAALLVGVGLGIQSLFSDYISGVIILFDNSIKVGDVIEVNQLVCQVLEIKLRTSQVLTRDDKYIIIPNTVLTKNPVINWTHHDVAARFEVTVNVDFSSDIQKVKQILIESVCENSQVLPEPKPFTRFSDFGEFALQFSVFFWTQDVFRVENIKGSIRETMYQKFKEQGIKIPYPQRVIQTI